MTRDEIRAALSDPAAPWYGSDLVPAVAELLEEIDCYDGMNEGVAVRIADLEKQNDKYRHALNLIEQTPVRGATTGEGHAWCVAIAAMALSKESP